MSPGGTTARWRKATWALVAWTGLTAVYLVAASNRSPACPALAGQTKESAIWSGTVFEICGRLDEVSVLWFILLIVLVVVWVISRPQRPPRSSSQGGSD